jgi:signal transduction histidine kinase
MDAQELQRENEALNEQVKLLVKTERRLYHARRTIELQLQRLQALTRLAAHAGRAGDPDVILDFALQTLLETLDVDQGAAFLESEPDRVVMAAMRTQPGREPPHPRWRESMAVLPSVVKPIFLGPNASVAPPDVRALLDAVKRFFGDEAAEIELVAPLLRQSRQPFGAIALRKLDLKASYHSGLVSEADLPFVELVSTRIEADVENVLLYRELRGFATELERKVAERTAQLVDASKKAAVLTLVGGLSHELNNPISVILGYAQELSSRASPAPRRQRALAAIERQARRCGTLVRALLAFAERRPVSLDSIPPRFLVEGLVAEVRDDARERGIDVRIGSIASDLPPLLVSVEEVHEALMHVVRNALDATPEGGTVVLDARAQQHGAVDGIELMVQDSGAGIPAAFLSRIFDPFFTTKPPGKGVGLGLSLARQSIESHGGRIDVRSAINRGTTVRVWLPTAPIDRPTQAEPERAAGGVP